MHQKKQKLESKPIKALYTYQLKTTRLNQFFNLKMEKSSSNGIPGMKWGLENDAYFATDDLNFYISCKPNPEELYINQETDTLIVWLNEIDRDKAISIFAKHLYDQINPELRSSKNFWDLVNKGYREAHIDGLISKV